MNRGLLEQLDLGKELVEAGIVTEEDAALLRAGRSPRDLVDHLLGEKRVSEAEILELVSQKMGVPYMDVSDYEVESSVLGLISPRTARKHQLVPLFLLDGMLNVAISNPLDVAALDAAREEASCEIEPILSTAQAIFHLINANYGKEDAGQEVLDLLSHEALPEVGPTAHVLSDEEDEDLSNAPVVKIVDLLLRRALAEEASDIHLEPGERSLRIRFRVDGRLREMPAPNWQLFPPIASRIKILADMDIAERRVPQDGRFEFSSEAGAADIRVSTYPTTHGESVVLRILDKARRLLGLTDLGFDPADLGRYERVSKKPFGILLVTGPTGSGKTTTLYGTLSSLTVPEKNIMTLEDPVEYRLPGVRQTQINPKAGLTFATGLKAILRQDPDVIMVGEIRDRDALDMTIRSAMTGHLVLTTLHTNDAPSSMVRLVDMGAEPFLVASTVVGIVAQRLVRRVCPSCKTPYQPSQKVLEELHRSGWTAQGPYYRGTGCQECRGLGYRGRIGVFELMLVTEEVERLVVKKAPASAIARVAREQGMIPLRETGLVKAAEGITTLDEVLEVTASTSS